MHKRMEITAQTKQNITDAFWALYCEKGIAEITVKEIAYKAGYNRGTFYEYFTDVYNVLDYIENSLIPSIDEIPPITIPSGTLGMPLDMFMKIYEQNSKYYSVLLGDKGDPAFASRLKNSIKPTLLKVFEEKHSNDKVRMNYIMEYTLTAMIGVMSYWFGQSDPLPSDQLYELMHQLMEGGVLKQLQ